MIHIPKWCAFATIDDCKEEAKYFYYDPKDGEHANTYLCLDHAADMSDGEEGEVGEMIYNGQQELVELGVYSCSEECRVCN